MGRAWRERLTPAGRCFIVPTLVFTAIGATSLDNHIYIGCLYALAFWLVAFPFAIFDAPRVKVEARHADRVSAGETLTVDVDVEQVGRFPHADITIVPNRLPDGIEDKASRSAVIALTRRGERKTARLELTCARRGSYDLSGWCAQTDFPAGLMHPRRVFKHASRLLVYPAYTQLVDIDIPTGWRYHPGGVALASKLGESFEYLGNREYREGDNIRDMDWRATSRLNRPIIREYREEYFHRVAIVLDTYVPPKGPAQRSDDLERSVSLSAAVSDYMARQEYLVDIFAAGPNLYHLTAGRSLAYIDQILDILACVESSPSEPFEILEPEIRAHLAQITTIVCVMLDWNDARRAFVDQVVREGASVKVVVVRDGPCTIEPGAMNEPFPITLVDAARFAGGVTRL